MIPKLLLIIIIKLVNVTCVHGSVLGAAQADASTVSVLAHCTTEKVLYL